MATDGEAPKDMRAHESSYGLFVSMMKWGTLLAVITGAIVIFVIAK